MKMTLDKRVRHASRVEAGITVLILSAAITCSQPCLTWHEVRHCRSMSIADNRFSFHRENTRMATVSCFVGLVQVSNCDMTTLIFGKVAQVHCCWASTVFVMTWDCVLFKKYRSQSISSSRSGGMLSGLVCKTFSNDKRKMHVLKSSVASTSRRSLLNSLTPNLSCHNLGADHWHSDFAHYCSLLMWQL